MDFTQISLLLCRIFHKSRSSLYETDFPLYNKKREAKWRMETVKRCLIVIDYQNDFVDGSLGFAQAPMLDHGIAEKIRLYHKRGDTVMFTLDTHSDDYLTTQEGQKLPVPHCIAGTPGHSLYGETATCRQKQDMVFFKPSFGSMELTYYLRMHPYQEIELVGVVTNICVISNAILCKAALPEARVRVDASLCASNDEALHKKALDVLRGLQIEVIND